MPQLSNALAPFSAHFCKLCQVVHPSCTLLDAVWCMDAPPRWHAGKLPAVGIPALCKADAGCWQGLTSLLPALVLVGMPVNKLVRASGQCQVGTKDRIRTSCVLERAHGGPAGGAGRGPPDRHHPVCAP